MPKEELTDPYIRHHSLPEKKKRIELYDSKVDGLMLRITPTGVKTFSFRYRVHGNLKRYTIGRFPKVGLSEARKVAKTLASSVAAGKDPQAKKVERRDDLTIEQLAEEFISKHLPDLKETTQVDYKNRINTVIVPAIGGIVAKELTASDVLDLLEDIAVDAPIQSNRVRAILSSMYSFGQNQRFVVANPVITVKPVGKENQRDRYYNPEELRIIWDVFNDTQHPTGTVMKMLLITGQRLGETKRMEWNHIENGIWTIPKEQTKAKREHKLPLPQMAIDLLKEIEPITGASQHVFESPLKKGQPVSWVHYASKKVRDHKGGPDDFRIHDLRRTVATYMAEIGVNRTVLGKVLNHKSLAGDTHVTSRYDRYDYMPEKERAMNLWNSHLKQMLRGEVEPDQVAGGAKIYRLR